jgi:uncharacterized repeat protein (TIGR03803 family)
MSRLCSWKTVLFFCVFCAATAITSPAQAGCSAAAPCFTILASFNGADGSLPVFGPLVQGFDGNLYGTAGGGAHSDGVVFKITPGGTLTPLHSFDGTDGAAPAAGLVLTANGNFYGTTVSGGAHGDGTIFKFVLNPEGTGGTLTSLHSFDGADGSNPHGGLVQGTDGNFYGTTQAGGASATAPAAVARSSPSKLIPRAPGAR